MTRPQSAALTARRSCYLFVCVRTASLWYLRSLHFVSALLNIGLYGGK